MYAGSIPTLPLAIALVAVGFCVGVAGSFFGVGGAFLVTPALNILGFPMAYAIGTDLAHMTGKSIIASIRHRRLGHIDFRAGALLLLGTLPGVKLGAMSVMKLERIGAIEIVIRLSYIVILTLIGALVLRESLRANRGHERERDRALLVRCFRIPPLVCLSASNIKSISIWGIILLGFATGFLAAFLGVGGGFIRMPALIYLIGMPTRLAIGTDLIEVAFSGAFGTYLYAREGRVDVIAALVMLMGAAVGSHLGTLATKYVESGRIRLYFAITVLCTALAVTAKQLGFRLVSAGILLTLGIALVAPILYGLFKGIRDEKAASLEKELEAR